MLSLSTSKNTTILTKQSPHSIHDKAMFVTLRHIFVVFTLSLLVCCCTIPSNFSFAATTFTDVNKSTDHSADITWLVDAGISMGWTEPNGTKTFRPYASVARGDMAAFLFRMARNQGLVENNWSPSAQEEKAFSDVTANTEHRREILWLASTGISKGWDMPNGTKQFRPYEPVARQDMAAFLFRLGTLMNVGDADESWTAQTATKTKFIDVSPTATDNHHVEVWWLAETGVSKGWENKNGTCEFKGLTNVARCDMAAFLHRMNNLPKSEIETDEEEVIDPDIITAPDLNPDYANIADYNDDVKLVNNADYAVTGDNKVDISANQLPAGLSEGDVLVLAPTDDNPRGAAIKLDENNSYDGNVSGTQPEIEELFDEIDIETSSPTTKGSFTAEDDVVIVAEDSISPQSLTETPDVTVILPNEVHDAAANRSTTMTTQYVNNEGKSASKFKVKYKCFEITFKLTGHFKHKYGLNGIQELRASVEMENSLAVKGRFSDFFGTEGINKKLGTVIIPTGVPGLYWDGGVWFNLDADGEVSLSTSATVEMGFDYTKKNGMKWIWQDETKQKIGASAEVSSGFDFTGSVALYGTILADPALELRVKLGIDTDNAKVRSNGMRCNDLTLKLAPSISIGKHEGLLKRLGFSYQKDISPKTLKKLHLENSKFVSKCSWKNNQKHYGELDDSTELDEKEVVVLGEGQTSTKGTCGGCQWTIADDTLTISPLNGKIGALTNWDAGSNYSGPPWLSYAHDQKVKHVVVKSRVKAKTCINMFAYLYSVEDYDLSGLDTCDVQNMHSMFGGSPWTPSFHDQYDYPLPTHATTIDLSYLDTSHVTDMSQMFYGNTALTSIDVSNFDTRSLTDISAMFENCFNLEDIGVSAWKIPENCKDIYCFENCPLKTRVTLLKNWESLS